MEDLNKYFYGFIENWDKLTQEQKTKVSVFIVENQVAKFPIVSFTSLEEYNVASLRDEWLISEENDKLGVGVKIEKLLFFNTEKVNYLFTGLPMIYGGAERVEVKNKRENPHYVSQMLNYSIVVARVNPTTLVVDSPKLTKAQIEEEINVNNNFIYVEYNEDRTQLIDLPITTQLYISQNPATTSYTFDTEYITYLGITDTTYTGNENGVSLLPSEVNRRLKDLVHKLTDLDRFTGRMGFFDQAVADQSITSSIGMSVDLQKRAESKIKDIDERIIELGLNKFKRNPSEILDYWIRSFKDDQLIFYNKEQINILFKSIKESVQPFISNILNDITKDWSGDTASLATLEDVIVYLDKRISSIVAGFVDSDAVKDLSIYGQAGGRDRPITETFDEIKGEKIVQDGRLTQIEDNLGGVAGKMIGLEKDAGPIPSVITEIFDYNVAILSPKTTDHSFNNITGRMTFIDNDGTYVGSEITTNLRIDVIAGSNNSSGFIYFVKDGTPSATSINTIKKTIRQSNIENWTKKRSSNSSTSNNFYYVLTIPQTNTTVRAIPYDINNNGEIANIGEIFVRSFEATELGDYSVFMESTNGAATYSALELEILITESSVSFSSVFQSGQKTSETNIKEANGNTTPSLNGILSTDVLNAIYHIDCKLETFSGSFDPNVSLIGTWEFIGSLTDGEALLGGGTKGAHILGISEAQSPHNHTFSPSPMWIDADKGLQTGLNGASFNSGDQQFSIHNTTASSANGTSDNKNRAYGLSTGLTIYVWRRVS